MWVPSCLESDEEEGDADDGQEGANPIDTCQNLHLSESFGIRPWWWLVAKDETDHADEIPQTAEKKAVAPGGATDDEDGVEELWHEWDNRKGDEGESNTSPACWSNFCDTGIMSEYVFLCHQCITYPASATSSAIPAPRPPIA